MSFLKKAEITLNTIYSNFQEKYITRKPFDVVRHSIGTPQQEAANQSHSSQQCGKSKEESLVHTD